VAVMRTTLAALGLAASGAVGWWSLAVPGDKDPLGDAARAATRAVGDTLDGWRSGDAANFADAAMNIPGADPARGRDLVRISGCGTCHAIPGLPGARGTVGPPLTGLRDRAYLAGVLPNRPDDLVSWLMNPPRHAPETAMPDLGLTEEEARDMAAWLYTLDGTE